MAHLHIKLSKKELQKIFEEYDKDHSGKIDFEEFRNILQEKMKKTELIEIYAQYCGAHLNV